MTADADLVAEERTEIYEPIPEEAEKTMWNVACGNPRKEIRDDVLRAVVLGSRVMSYAKLKMKKQKMKNGLTSTYGRINLRSKQKK